MKATSRPSGETLGELIQGRGRAPDLMERLSGRVLENLRGFVLRPAENRQLPGRTPVGVRHGLAIWRGAPPPRGSASERSKRKRAAVEEGPHEDGHVAIARDGEQMRRRQPERDGLGIAQPNRIKLEWLPLPFAL